MASDDVAAQVTSEPLKREASPVYSKHAAQDIKPSDAEENHNSGAAPGELKRKLKSRHLQMIAIGMF
jgi:amino acid transporter